MELIQFLYKCLKIIPEPDRMGRGQLTQGFGHGCGLLLHQHRAHPDVGVLAGSGFFMA